MIPKIGTTQSIDTSTGARWILAILPRGVCCSVFTGYRNGVLEFKEVHRYIMQKSKNISLISGCVHLVEIAKFSEAPDSTQ